MPIVDEEKSRYEGGSAASIGTVFTGALFGQQPAREQEKQTEPTAQNKLEQTCNLIRSGQLENPPEELADVCRKLEEEEEKKKEQTKENMEFSAGKFCGAPWAPDTPQSARVKQVLPKLGPTFHRQYPSQNATFLVVKSPIINAWTLIGNPRSLMCLPTGMIDFLSGDGELAFAMGHETGHAVGQACKNHKNDLSEQRVCESRADAVGFDLLVKSGFSPFEAGAAFGKLEMYSGDIKTDLGARLQALGKDHPMTPERVQHVHDMLAQYKVVLNGPLAH
jgi:Zn-dependent protease with chaperone function